MNNLKEFYKKDVVAKLFDIFKYKNIHQVPKIKKISINVGLGLNAQSRSIISEVIEGIRCITGQHPIITKAKSSIAGFKTRKNVPLGLKVTLRKEKMYCFLERYIKLTLPNIRDFRGLNKNSFDRRGNYNVGVYDMSIFPEVKLDSITKRCGLNITIVTSAKNKIESFCLLKEIGLPFQKDNLEKHII